jgi:hypothetical protein
LGGIEINKKEFLIFDTRSGSAIPVSKDNFQQHAQSLNSGCGTSVSGSWDQIEDFIRQLNASCR